MSDARPLPSPPTAHPAPASQLRSVRSLRRHKGLLALTTVAVAASAFFATLVQSRVYRATAVVRVPDASQTSAELTRLRSSKVHAAVAKQTGTPPPVEIDRATRPGQIRIVAESNTAKGAANLANGYFTVALAQLQADRAAATADKANELRARSDDLQRQIDALTADLAGARPQAAAAIEAKRADLQHQQADAQSQLSQLNADPMPALATPARAPSSPVRPKPLRNALIGAALGFLFGLVIVLILGASERRRDRPEGTDRPERTHRPERPAKPVAPAKRPPPLVPAAARSAQTLPPLHPQAAPQTEPEPDLVRAPEVTPVTTAQAPPMPVVDPVLPPEPPPSPTPAVEAAMAAAEAEADTTPQPVVLEAEPQ